MKKRGLRERGEGDRKRDRENERERVCVYVLIPVVSKLPSYFFHTWGQTKTKTDTETWVGTYSSTVWHSATRMSSWKESKSKYLIWKLY